MRERTRLSYVELVIIAIVLGIAGRIIVPALTEGSTEEKVSALVERLSEMRSHLDLYRAHHAGNLPASDSFEGFQSAMTTKAGRYDPYIKKIPVNPFNGLNTVRFDGEPAGVDKAGWRLDTRSGLFQADNSAEYAEL